MADRIITIDGSNPDKPTPTGADKLVIIDVATNPDTLKETKLTDFLKNYMPFYTPYQIVPSVSANNLTVAIKTLIGQDPSVDDPLKFRIGNADYTVVAATSYTKNAGTNWHNAGGAELAAQNIDFFVYAIGETGAATGIKFGHSRIPYATTMGDFVNTATNEKYIAGNWTNFNATDAVFCIGRFRAQLSAGAAFNWSMPSSKIINYPIFETDWLNWTPTLTGYSANPTNTVYRYKINRENVKLQIREGTNGTSNATTLTLTLPFTAVTLSNASWVGTGAALDNGAALTTAIRIDIASGAALANVFPNMSAASLWTNVNGKRIAIGNVEYAIQ